MAKNHNSLLNQISAVAHCVPLPIVEAIANSLEKVTTEDWSYLRNQVLQSVSQPELRIQVGQLLKSWQTYEPQLSPQSVALALLAAAETEEYHRQSESMELVWTGPQAKETFLRRTDQALLQVINVSQHQLLVVSFAVYKIANIRTALVKAAERGVSITICVEAPEPSEGKITYDTIKALGSRVANNATVYIWPKDKRPQTDDGKHGSLHVKCAVADEKMLFISSANLTEFALALNMELGVLIQGGPLPGDVASHFDRLIEDGVLALI